MEKPKRVEIVRNILVLLTLIGLVLFSWMLGHILRYSIPGLWHPRIPEIDPHIRYGGEFESEGIRRLAAFPGLALVDVQVKADLREQPSGPPEECLSLTYYTSLPAKCWTSDWRFVSVSGIESNVSVIPPSK
jgi:hypothetical protein